MSNSVDSKGLVKQGNRPVIVPGMPGTSGPRTIVSVFPMEQSLRLRHEGCKDYVLPAAPKDSYVALQIHDTYSWNRNFNADKFALYAAAIPASVVADNLVQRFATGMIGTKDGLGPGIKICAGEVPTPEEVEEVRAIQSEYFRYLINEADTLLAMDKPGDIVALHRLAADWMGAHDRKWFKPLTHVSMAACVACSEEIRTTAKICRWCHTNQSEFIEREKARAKAAPKA